MIHHDFQLKESLPKLKSYVNENRISTLSSNSSLYNHSECTASSVHSDYSVSSQASTTTTGGLRYCHHTASLKEYGKRYKLLGEGSSATVMILKKTDLNQEDQSINTSFYAVKQYHKKSTRESKKEYMKRLTSEFCISSTFTHPNIVQTFDLVLDSKDRYCTIMEYCSGGDLFSIIMAEIMTDIEKACCFKQLLQGISYLHSVGVTHRDIKPENLLMTAQGKLKITDFGVSDVFRRPWETKGYESRGLCGSEPYIAPETFTSKSYWGPSIDVWSAGIVFYSIWLNGIIWERAVQSNSSYRKYLDGYSTFKRELNNRTSFYPFNSFTPAQRQVLYCMLDPIPKNRITVDELLENDPWIKSIACCNHDSIDSYGQTHKHIIHRS
ncbi:kinase-like domain-containing protein [Cokeromyces recurvatus]|uniref:kinase-like domain-containing protein n=1 Tax=Cokeromyces recurvatus TaxID=90255 RepID=UPI00221FF899|nr:kinase-like domain-containing protein [Cokeromyces recurvatus]KAI7905831.1 kinase-like domain-containing protein [Cokeromyces recurvatus]